MLCRNGLIERATNMEIRTATIEDFDTVYDIWRRHRKQLGPAWKITIQRQLNKGEFYIAFDNSKCIGMICMHYSKKYSRYEIHALVIEEAYRRKKHGLELVKYAVQRTENKALIGVNVPIYVAALDGDINNLFYDTFGTVEWYNEYKTCRTRVYKVDKERLWEA